jgi:dipeptidyl aminopeptidase/acylaminoacyl peptidase
MPRFYRLLSLILFSLPLTAQKHPFTFEDMMALKRIEEPEPSPDGKWVLFAAVDVDLKANTKTPHVWVVPLSGGAEREVIADQDADRPRWSPDGKHFAFISKKEGGSQIWIADFDSGTGTVTAKHKLTSIVTEASGELWSPDGKNILFQSDVYPECDGAPAQESDCNAKRVEEANNSEVKAQIFTHLLYRHWKAFKEGKRSHLLLVPANACVGTAAPAVQSGKAGQASSAESQTIRAEPDRTAGGGCPYTDPRDLTPGDYDAPQFNLGGQDNYAFSPDGKEICYTSNHDRVGATSTNNDLWIAPINGGQTKNITAENKASDSTPLYSPDGKYIAYRAQQRPGYESDRFRLMLYDRKTGEKKNLTENFDRWVGTFTWWGSTGLLFSAEDQGNARVYYTDLDQTKPSVLKTAQGYDDDLTVSKDGKFLLYTQMSAAAPAEIYKSPIVIAPTAQCEDSGNICTPQEVTHINKLVLQEVSMSPLESFWFTGAHNDKVQGFLVKPPNFDPNKKYPVKFIIHGGPEVPMGDEWSYRWNFELFAASGYVVVFINFHGSPGYGQNFIDAINGDWGGAPFEDLMEGLDYAEQHFAFIDKDRECALGASYGGYMANWILGHTNRFKCVVTHDGMFNTESAWGTTEELWFNEWEFKGTPYTNRELYRKWSPHLFATNFKTPTLVIHSQLDYRLDVSEGFQLFTTLQREGVPSKMLYFPDEGHWILKPQNSQLWYKTVNEWVDQWSLK